jgi:hypothetical protein
MKITVQKDEALRVIKMWALAVWSISDAEAATVELTPEGDYVVTLDTAKEAPVFGKLK